MTQDVTMLSVQAYANGAQTPEEVQAYVDQRIGSQPPVEPQASAPAESPAEPVQQAAETASKTSGETASKSDAAQTSSFDYSRFGVKDEEELQQRFEQYKKYEEEINDIKPKWEKVAPIIEVADYIKNPFNDPLVQQLNNVIANGIKDPKLAIELLTTSTEDLKANPIKTLTIAKIIEDNSILGMSMDRIERQVKRENGVDISSDFSDLSEDEKETLEFKAAKALKTIEAKKSEWSKTNDIFATWQQDAQAQQTAKAKNVEEWGKHLPKIVSGLTEITLDVDAGDLGKIPVKVPVTKEEVASAVQLMSGSLSNISPDAQGQAQLSDALKKIVTTAKTEHLVKAAIEHYDKSLRANIEQEIRKKNHNGGAAIESPAPSGDGKRDATMEAVKKLASPLQRKD